MVNKTDGTVSKFNLFKPTKRKIIVITAILAAAGLMAGFMQMGQGAGGAKPGAEVERTAPLARGDLSSSVNTTGTVYSTKTTDVYSTLSYQVKAVYVEVGDRVNEGDILAELNSASLEADIAQKEASMANSQSTAQQNLSTAQQDLANYKNNVDNNYDTNLINARAAVTTAELDVQTAELDVQSAANEVRIARRNLQDARNGEGKYEETGVASDSEIAQLRDTLALKETTLEMKQTTLESRKASLEKAKAALAAAEKSASDSLATYQSKVKSAQINNNFDDQNIALEKLKSDLEKCVITAPVSGTVTAVKATEGGSGNGLLFVIQDTDNLKVVTNIKEYDIGSVNIGDRVIIKADATGSREFPGTLSKLAPTSTLTTTGTTSSSTDAEFESEVLVNRGAQGLRIGMNARLSIITEERKGVFYVSYESIGTDADGSFHIYVLNTGADGKVSYDKIQVQTGLETNLYVEISGDGLEEGMQVVKNAQSVSGGSDAAPAAGNGGNMQGGAAFMIG